MKAFLAAYFGMLICYLVLDGIWLGLIAKESYTSAMQGMLRETYPILPWVVFYLMYCAVAVRLVISPHRHSSGKSVIFDGALLGLAAYGAYNLTNFAILQGWPLDITIQDWLWGTFVTSISCGAGWFAQNRILTQRDSR